MNIGDIVEQKGHTVIGVQQYETAAQMLSVVSEHNIGAVVVLDNTKVVGVCSERDVARALAKFGGHVLVEPVSGIMSTPVHTCSLTDSVSDVMEQMTDGHMRHMPVLENNTLVGLVSIGDVVAAHLNMFEFERRNLIARFEQSQRELAGLTGGHIR